MRLAERARPRVLVRRESWVVLAALVAAQWIAVAVFAATTRHNGWLFYQGGDHTLYYTTAWSFAHGQLPHIGVGYAWSLILTPIAAFAGPNVLDALPFVVLLEVAVLLPIGLIAAYVIAAEVGGRRFGYWATAVFVAAPLVAIPLFDDRYHDRYVDQTVAQLLGLSVLADFPSLIFVLVSAAAAARVVRTGDARLAALSAVLAGLAVGIKPANALYLAAPAAAFAVARRWRTAAVFAVALVPGIVTLAIWKERSLGHLPLFAFEETRLAAGVGAPFGLDKYVDLEWSHLQRNYVLLREFFWSAPLVLWLPVIGLVGVARRSLPLAALLGVWLVAFVVGKGSSDVANVESGTFFRLLMPAYAPFAILIAAAALAVPGLTNRFRANLGRSRAHTKAVGVGVTAAVVVPLLVVAALPQARGPETVFDLDSGVVVPVIDLDLRAQPARDDVVLRWRAETAAAAGSYRIFRGHDAPDVHDGLFCPPMGGAGSCLTSHDIVGITGINAFQFRSRPGVYRVGIAADYTGDPQQGDIVVLSRPVHVSP